MQRLRVLTALLCPFFRRLRERRERVTQPQRVSAQRMWGGVWRQAQRGKVSAQRVRGLQTTRPVLCDHHGLRLPKRSRRVRGLAQPGEVSARRQRVLAATRPALLRLFFRRLRERRARRGKASAQRVRGLTRRPTPLSALVGIRLVTHTRFGARPT